MRFSRLGSSVLLTLCVAAASAEPGYGRRDARDAVRAYHIQSVTLERNLPREPQQVQPQERPRQGLGQPESSGHGLGGEAQSQQQAHQQTENQRRQGRMTPEERRALRRQIDEAGHDIYRPKH
jgi:hypothetical protein